MRTRKDGRTEIHGKQAQEIVMGNLLHIINEWRDSLPRPLMKKIVDYLITTQLKSHDLDTEVSYFRKHNKDRIFRR